MTNIWTTNVARDFIGVASPRARSSVLWLHVHREHTPARGPCVEARSGAEQRAHIGVRQPFVEGTERLSAVGRAGHSFVAGDVDVALRIDRNAFELAFVGLRERCAAILRSEQAVLRG